MNQLEERNYYEQEDELDLLDLVRTLMKHKYMIAIVTIVITLFMIVGGYFYNKSKAITTTIITLNYPGRENGKTPNGALLTTNEIVPLDVLNNVYDKHKDIIKEKDKRDFINSVELVSVVPDYIKKRIEEAEKKGEKYIYTPSEFQIVSKDNKKIVDDIANESVASFIERYRPNYTIQPIKIEGDYDYPTVFELISDKIDTLKTLVNDRDKKHFISNKSGYSFDKIRQNIESLEKLELQDYYSYYTVHNLSLDMKAREVRYKSDIQVLKLQREGLIFQRDTIKKMIDDYRPGEKSFIIGNVGELQKKLDQSDEYYGKLIDQYLSLNKAIVEKEQRIKKLEEENKVALVYPTEQQKEKMNLKLDVLINRLNSIIEDVNTINDEYIRVTYSNMISITAPVIETTSGKPLYIYLAVGIILGLFTGIFFSFIAEFKEDYKKRYAK
ncbi:Wzz/FepE/Etk N-terminal domain-containing protein [Fusobacterium sp.]|uniref:Wzz/FepE/Etk N-terminal domain-containing protein n=1 Tax=Fusobacterium sp. TaxID=68766 RepID=UPI000C7083E1|nr:Wzz/FepE/Etk N-terminal domain-containing protein [Fusobacterium sp.]